MTWDCRTCGTHEGSFNYCPISGIHRDAMTPRYLPEGWVIAVTTLLPSIVLNGSAVTASIVDGNEGVELEVQVWDEGTRIPLSVARALINIFDTMPKTEHEPH